MKHFDPETLAAVIDALRRGDHATVEALKRKRGPRLYPVQTEGKSNGEPRGQLRLVQ